MDGASRGKPQFLHPTLKVGNQPPIVVQIHLTCAD